MTHQDIITQALQLLNAIDPGEGPSTAESADAFVTYSALIDSLSAQEAPISKVTREVINLGTTGEMTLATRPQRIKSANITALVGIIAPCRVVTAEQWSTGGGTFSEPFLFCDYGFPQAKIYVRPPLSSAFLELYTLQPLTRPANLAEIVEMAPGYERMLINCLAAELWPQYPNGVTKEYITGLATDAKLSVQGPNSATLGPVVPPQQQPQ